MALADSHTRPAASLMARSALPLFATTLFLSAFLLFSVQPFFAKLVLPRLGGSPAVWSVAMVFFQAMLLLGYLYAHVIISRFSLRTAALIHGAVLVTAFVALPIAIPQGWDQPPANGQSFWLLGLFGAAVGLPFFAVAANAPLLQAWFSRTGHPHASDPYFLYGSSNIGSFASLLLFIVLIEPLFTVGDQSRLWTAGFAVLAALIGLCALCAVRLQGASAVLASAGPRTRAQPLQILRWVGLAFVPSGLLVAVTAHISVDVAAAPFLWVTPLAFFLLTFVLVFRQKPLFSENQLSSALPWFAALAVGTIFLHGFVPVWASLFAHLAFYFVAALACHTVLYALRPDASGLTGFYLWMSFGGVLGGIFASLIAPLAFDWVAEYLLLIVAALLMRRALWRAPVRDLAIFAAIALALIAAAAAFGASSTESTGIIALLAVLCAAVAALAARRSEPIFLLAALMIAPLGFIRASSGEELFRDRTFFGVVKVAQDASRTHHVMSHGTTIHGAMRVRDAAGDAFEGRPEPVTYYHRSGGIARALFAAQEKAGGAIGRGGVVGLGTGSILCHSQPGEAWVGFEIDPSVVEIARDPVLFRFVSDCQPDIDIVVGDARLTLADQLAGGFDYLLIDAFSSDAIPAHLMTREAIALYMSRMTSDGMLVMHISNRYLELETVIAAAAEAEGLEIRTLRASIPDEQASADQVAASHVAVLGRSVEALGPLAQDPAWITPDPRRTTAWTDDFSNVFTALLRGL